MNHFDAIIIGTGQAQNLVNLRAAEKAAQVSTSIDAGIGSSSVFVMMAKVAHVRLGGWNRALWPDER